MNTRFTLGAVAALALTPFLAQGAEIDSIQSCMNQFAALNFPEHAVSLVVQDDTSVPVPLMARSGTRMVELVAVGKTSGHVYGTATCNARTGKLEEGTVTVLPLRT